LWLLVENILNPTFDNSYKDFSKEFNMPVVDGVYAAALLGEGMLAVPNG